MSAELLAPGLIIGAAFESAYPVAKGNYYDIEARIWPTHRCTCACTCCTCTCTRGMSMRMGMSSSTSTSTSRPALHDHTRACSPLTRPHPRTRRATRMATPPLSTWRACRQAAAWSLPPIPRYTSLYLPASPDIPRYLAASPARHAPRGRARLLLLWRGARADGALRLLRRAAGCGC